MKRYGIAWICLAFTLALLSGCGGAEDRKAEYLKRGMEYFDQGNYDKARVEFKNVIQIDPKDVEAHYRLGLTLEKLQDWRGAVGQFLAALELDERHTEARVHLGQIYLLAGNLDKAAEQADAALLHDPQSPEALAFRGTVRLRQGDLDGARRDARAALEIDPAHIKANALLASVLLKEGKPDEAATQLEGAVALNPKDTQLRTLLAGIYVSARQQDKAVALLREIVALEPDKLAHRLRLARLLTGLKRLDEAQKVLEEAVTALPEESGAKLALVEFLARARGADPAIETLKGYIEKAPDDYTLRFALAKLYEAARKVDDAIAVYREIIERDGTGPKGLTARTRLADLQARLRKFDQAKELLAEVLQENPNDQQALILRGRIEMASGEVPAAISDFRTVLRDQPNSIPLHRLLARAHLLNKEPELARDTLKKAIAINPRDLGVRSDYIRLLASEGKTDEVVSQLEEVLQISPDNLGALESLFKVQAARKDWAAAREVAERIERKHPDKAMGYYLAGLIDQAEGKLEQSLSRFEEALKRAPDAVQPLTQMVKSYLALERPDDALAYLDKVLEKNPKNFVALNLRGEVLMLKGELDDAAEAFADAIDLKPQWPLPYRNLAALRLRQEKPEEAVAVYEKGVKATDGNAAMIIGLAALYEQTGQVDKAIKLYEDVLVKERDSELAANNLAMLLADYKKDEASLKRARNLVAPLLDKENAAYQDTVGWVLYRNGDLDGALDHLRRALKLAPDAPGLHYHLARVLLKKGDRKAALEHLRKAVTDQARYHGLEEARKLLKKLKKG